MASVILSIAPIFEVIAVRHAFVAELRVSLSTE